MQVFRRASYHVFCVGALVAMLISVASANSQTLRILISAPVPSTIPAHNTANLVLGFQRHIFETLTINRDGKLEGLLATSWEPSADRKGWIFKLRQGVKFSDGAPFNADAVVKNVEYYFKTKRPMPARGSLGPIAGARAIDEYTVEITTSQPFSGLPLWQSHSFAGLVSPKSLADHGDDVGSRMASGTGPFMYSSVKLPDHFELKQNPNYWGTPAKLDKLDFKVVADDQTRLAALLSGAADLNFYVESRDVPRVEQTAGFNIITSNSIRLYIVHLPMKLPEMQDLRVRQALNYAIDRQTIVSQVFQGKARIAEGATGAGQIGFRAVGKIPFDPKKSMELFAEAGWTKDGSGILAKGGKQFPALTMVASNNRYPGDQVLAQAVAGYLQAVGVPVTLQLLDFATFITDTQRNAVKNNWLSQMQWGFSVEAASMICQVYASTGIWNLGAYNNQTVDKACVDIDNTFDSQARLKLIEETSEAIYKDLPAIYLLAPDFIVGERADLKDVILSPIESHNVGRAYLAK